MNATKQKILITSLELFNTTGVSNVSLRVIADAMGISVGNLQYHFKKREAIIEALYFEIVKKIDAIFLLKTDNVLQAFFNVSTEMFKVLFTYRFFLLDFVTITRNHQKIKKHYAALSKQRQETFLNIANVLIEKGLFRAPLLKDEYKNLYKRIEVLSNFWLSSVLIQAHTITDSSIEEYTLLVSQNMYPYLTDKAQKEYLKMFPNQRV